jgi:endonuclease/exonuclease/phosphatase (EEP) superfamily protein YafD
MKPAKTAHDAAPHPSPPQEQAEVAELAAKIVALPKQTPPIRGKDAAKRFSRLRRLFWWACYVTAWLTALSLVVVAGLRIFFHDGNLYLCWINAFTRYVYLPAYLCLAWAAWQRRWFMAFCSLAVVACHVVWMAPNFLRDRRFDSPADVAAAPADAVSTMRIFFANVLITNPEHQPLWEEIAEADPDVIVLAECNYPHIRSFRKSPLMTPYLRGGAEMRSQMGEVVVYSKLPIKNEMQNYVMGRVVQTVDIEVGSQTLRLVGLHAPRPVYPSEYSYARYWEEMIPVLTTEPTPLVIIGDFNATEHSRVYKQLRAAGLRSAHDDRGRGYATTWPNGKWRLPPIRIDQAFLSREVECTAIAEGRGKGSDHKPIIVDIRVREQELRPLASEPEMAQ